MNMPKNGSFTLIYFHFLKTFVFPRGCDRTLWLSYNTWFR